MAVYKEEKTGTWRAVYRYTDWNGERKQTQKRGFKTKREAQAWEREQVHKTSADLDMNFKSFVELYTVDMKTRLKENTWATKEHIIRTKLLPYFGKLKMCNITAQQIITWQNEMLNHKDEKGQPYSPVYLKTVHNQLSAIFNHAIRYYNLRDNPCKKAGSMGKKKNREMMFWTKEQYLKFAEVMMDKPLSFYAFEMLYWCGIREGELLALAPADFDFEKRTVTINKSYLGNVFSGVQCPSIILGITPNDERTVVGCRVTTENDSFVISKPRTFPDGTLSLNVSDGEKQCLDVIVSIKNAAYLKGNAKFALGIVTGNNKEYILAEKRDDNEIILKGSDIQRYRCSVLLHQCAGVPPPVLHLYETARLSPGK